MLSPVPLLSFQYLKDFSDEKGGDTNACQRLLCRLLVNYVKIWNICITQWTNTSEWSQLWVEDPYKKQVTEYKKFMWDEVPYYS